MKAMLLYWIVAESLILHKSLCLFFLLLYHAIVFRQNKSRKGNSVPFKNLSIQL